MDPREYLALSKDAQTAYLRSLSEADRLAFVSSMDTYEQQQNGNQPFPVIPPVGSLPINGVQKMTPPDAPPPLYQSPYTTASFEPNRDGRFVTKDGQLNTPPDEGGDKQRIKDMSVEEKDELLKQNVDKIKDRMTSLAGVTASFVDMANMSNPGQTEIAPSAIAGGVSGFAAGGPIGALIGATTGALKAANQRSSFDQQEAQRERTKFTGLRVAPTLMETGGMVADETLTEEDADIEIPVQEEVGEVMLFPDGKLVDSMATKKHKEMKGKEKDIPTDTIPNGTMIFSDSPKRMINLKDIKDDIFNITKGHYSEDGNTKGEVIRMGDVYGEKGEKTPAQLAKMVRKQTPIIENPVEQVEIDTNKENLKRRAEMLLPIMQMQEGVYKKFEYEKPMKFEKGGMVKKVKKYETGGTATSPCGPGFKQDAAGNCVPDIAALAKLDSSQANLALLELGKDPDYAQTVMDSVKNYRASMSGTVPGNPSMGPVGRDQSGACPPGYKKNALGECVPDSAPIVVGVPHTPKATVKPTTTAPSVTTTTVAPTATTTAPIKGDPNCEPGYYKPTPDSPCIPTDDLLASLSPEDRAIKQAERDQVFGRLNQAPPAAKLPMLPDAKPVSDSPAPERTTEPPYIPPTSLGIKLPELDGKVWDKVDSMIGDQKTQNEADYASSKEAAENLYRSTRFKNLGILTSRLMGDAMQNPEITPVTLGTEHVNSMFPKVTESQIESQINPVRNQQNRALSMINDSGLRGGDIGSAIASTQAKLIEAEGEVRNKALSVNQTQESKRLDRLKNIIDINKASEVNAENGTRSNRNKLVSDVGHITAESLKGGGELKVALHENLEKLKAWRQQNRNTITDSEFNAIVKKEEQKLDKAYKQKSLDQISALVSQFRVG